MLLGLRDSFLEFLNASIAMADLKNIKFDESNELQDQLGKLINNYVSQQRYITTDDQGNAKFVGSFYDLTEMEETIKKLQQRLNKYKMTYFIW